MKLRSVVALAGSPRWLRLLGCASLGAFTGMLLYVARISEALSYLSDDPKACINCHIMIPEYASWQHSSHHRVATCNDCHVPHDSALRKSLFKAKDGMRHSWLFTLRRERQVMQAIPESRRVIQDNCVRCHLRTVGDVGLDVHSDNERWCVDCHREVPHGRVHSLSATPNAAVPPLSPVIPEALTGGQ